MTKAINITIGKSDDGKPVAFDLKTLITTRALIQANSGAGKSYLLRALMEQLFGHVQIICIDPEGEFASLREKYPFVLIGKDGEAAADVRTAAMTAERLLELRASAICDIYEMRPVSDRHVWVKNFLNAMVNAPKRLWHPVAVIVDEAHMFCPEAKSGDSEAKSAMIDLASLGRKRGFFPVWATQRLAKVDKDATSMLQNRLVGGTFEDVDLKRAIELLSIAAEDQREFKEQLRTMEPGYFYAFGRAISKTRILFKGREVRTTHIEPGSTKHSAAPPPTPDKIRALLPKLSDLPKEAADRAMTLDDLRKQVRELTRDLAVAKKAVPAAPAAPALKASEVDARIKAAVDVAVDPLIKELKERDEAADDLAPKLIALLDKLDGLTKEFTAVGKSVGERLCMYAKPKKAHVLTEARAAFKALPPAKEQTTRETVARPATVITMRKPDSRPPSVDVESDGDSEHLPPGALRMLKAIARFDPNPTPQGQMLALAGISARSSTFRGYRNRLERNGLVQRDGSNYMITDRGRGLIGHVPPMPASTEEVVEIWRPTLAPGAQRMLNVLIENSDRVLSKEELGELSEVSPTASTFRAYMLRLKAACLVERSGSGFTANKETLFL